jgi:hypothetical protein
MSGDDESCGIVLGEPERADWQRPDISNPADPRGGFKSNPEFEIMGRIDNGGTWSSSKGNTRPRF